jgi:MFS family permease
MIFGSTAVVTRALVVTLALQAMVTMSALTVPVLAPEAAKDIGVDPDYIGIYASIIFMGAMTASLLSGAFVLRFGAIRTSQVCLLLSGIGIAAASGATVAILIASAMVLGIALGPATPSSSHVLARHTPARLRGLVFSIKQTSVPLGGMVAGLLVPLFVIELGWRGATWAVAAMCVALAIVVQPTRREFDTDLDQTGRLFSGNIIGPLTMVLRDRALRGPVLASFMFAGMQQTFSVFIVTYLVGALDMSLVKAGVALSVSQAGGIAGRILWGFVADLTGNARAVLGALGVASAIGTFACATFTVAWPFLAVLAVCAVVGATAIGWNGVYLAEIARLAPEGQAGRATGGALFVTFFGVVAAPVVFSGLAAFTGSYEAGFAVLAASTGIAGLALLRPRKSREA